MARADLPPTGLGFRDQIEWMNAACTWRVGPDANRAGWVESRERVDCFALAKYNAIVIDQDERIPAEDRAAWREHVTLNYRYPDGRTEICRLIPIRARYEDVAWDDVSRAFAGGRVDQLLTRLNANLTQSCQIR